MHNALRGALTVAPDRDMYILIALMVRLRLEEGDEGGGDGLRHSI